MSDQRHKEAVQIAEAYAAADRALAHLGRLLRSTDAGTYLWAAPHKTAVSGIRAVLKALRNDVPNYEPPDQS